jgi:hypothetical protein
MKELRLRRLPDCVCEIGPASPSGRIDNFAVLESNPAVFYVATATGGLWKTVNQGTTLSPVGFLKSLRQADACHGQ